MKLTPIIAVVLLAPVAAGCGSREVATTPSPVTVITTQVRPVAVAMGMEYSGTVEETASAMLSFPVGGTVQTLAVVEGQRVARGQLIATLNEATLRSAYVAAEAALAQAEDAYERYRQLHDSNSLPEIQWVEVQSKLAQARSSEQIARKNLDDGRLYAPFAGVVSEKVAEVGQNVMPGSPVVRLVAVDRVKVCISVPEGEVSTVDVGRPVAISVGALGGRVFAGTIVEKGIAANPLSRTYAVRALFDNSSGALMPGMLCSLRLADAEGADAIVLPTSVVQLAADNTNFVWVNREGVARRQPVVVGELAKEGVVIADGLAVGDIVIIEGQQKVSDGTPLTINHTQP